MKDDTKEQVLTRLRKIAGQVEGIERMVQQDRYCVDVMLQVSAARAALAKVSKLVLEAHIQTCVTDAFRSDDRDAREAKIEELVRLFDKNCRC